MRQKHNGGFSLIEVLVGIALLGVFVVPTCAGLVMSHRMNAKADALLKAQLAVSSAVEIMMAEGISDEDYEFRTDGDEKIDRFPDVTMKIEKGSALYYSVTVTDNNNLVSVDTSVRAVSQMGGG